MNHIRFICIDPSNYNSLYAVIPERGLSVCCIGIVLEFLLNCQEKLVLSTM